MCYTLGDARINQGVSWAKLNEFAILILFFPRNVLTIGEGEFKGKFMQSTLLWSFNIILKIFYKCKYIFLGLSVRLQKFTRASNKIQAFIINFKFNFNPLVPVKIKIIIYMMNIRGQETLKYMISQAWVSSMNDEISSSSSTLHLNALSGLNFSRHTKFRFRMNNLVFMHVSILPRRNVVVVPIPSSK